MNYWAFDPHIVGLKQTLYAHLQPPVSIPTARPVLHQAVTEDRGWDYKVAAEDQVIDFQPLQFEPSHYAGLAVCGLDG